MTWMDLNMQVFISKKLPPPLGFIGFVINSPSKSLTIDGIWRPDCPNLSTSTALRQGSDTMATSMVGKSIAAASYALQPLRCSALLPVPPALI